MAFFYPCNTETPIDWYSYEKEIQSLIEKNLSCLSRNIKTNIRFLPKEIIQEIKTLLNEYQDSIDDTLTNLQTLINTLAENPNGSVCFDKCLFKDYITSYEKSKFILNKINLFFTTYGGEISSDLNVGVDLLTINIDNTLQTSNKLKKCNGVYMKQMDMGSEFIGSVMINQGLPEKETEVVHQISEVRGETTEVIKR